ncbi:hypothetical protein JW962_01180 [Candidatus Dojkabacteria bacterium]|nr:hypothetical protein [Candidatus Dojkabacteria bacterium]
MSENKKRLLSVVWALGIVVIVSFLLYSTVYLVSFLIRRDLNPGEDSNNVRVKILSDYQFVGFLTDGILVKDSSGIGYLCNETCEEIVSSETDLIRGSGDYFGYSGVLGGSSPNNLYNYYQSIFVSTLGGVVFSLPDELFSDFIIWDERLYLITYKEISSATEDISTIRVYDIGDTGLLFLEEFSIQLEVSGDILNGNTFYTVFPREPIAYFRNNDSVQSLAYTDDFVLLSEDLCSVSVLEQKLMCDQNETNLPKFVDAASHDGKLYLLSSGDQATVEHQSVNDINITKVSLPVTDSAKIFCLSDKCVVQQFNLLTILDF